MAESHDTSSTTPTENHSLPSGMSPAEIFLTLPRQTLTGDWKDWDDELEVQRNTAAFSLLYDPDSDPKIRAFAHLQIQNSHLLSSNAPGRLFHAQEARRLLSLADKQASDASAAQGLSPQNQHLREQRSAELEQVFIDNVRNAQNDVDGVGSGIASSAAARFYVNSTTPPQEYFQGTPEEQGVEQGDQQEIKQEESEVEIKQEESEVEIQQGIKQEEGSPESN
ncbi:hypothetical protein Micbo1qcDRAFT_207601 [Microdochium bolleyi]|uniref:Uncharacterized protein n=1 Tax=Microdochium bolleyi TaxID=196109 RepID=A0A136ISP9_9PEZI|nr:hypothetical protein Micbo1qcDRAFT_207601 [Microdochium bolleyi]